MKSYSKILGTVLAAAFAVGMLAAPASANSDKKPTGVGILPALAGPLGAAALVGPTTSTFHWFTHSFYKVWVPGKFKYVWKYGQLKKIYVPGHKKYVHVKKKHAATSKSRSAQGKAIVGCVMGSALGAISASIRKASALGNPIRWRSQAEHEAIVKSGYEKQFELTSDEAATALAFCGLGSFALNWQAKAPVVVKAKY